MKTSLDIDDSVKVVEQDAEGGAMAQLKSRGYADKHRARGRPVHLVAVEFSRATRNLRVCAVERFGPDRLLHVVVGTGVNYFMLGRKFPAAQTPSVEVERV